MYPLGILRKLPHNLEISDIRNRMNTRLMVANIEVIIVLFGSILLFFLLSVCLKLSILIPIEKSITKKIIIHVMVLISSMLEVNDFTLYKNFPK